MRQLVEDFNSARVTYLGAKQRYDDCYCKVLEANKEWNNLSERGLISDEEWAEKTTDTELNMGLDVLRRNLCKAEEKLIQAGRKALEAKMSKEQSKEISKVWSCKFVSVREAVVDVLLKWDAET